MGRHRSPATLIVFDLLHLDGRAVRELSYRRRRELLDELVLDGPAWSTPRYFGGDEGAALIRATAELGLEGVVAKRLDALYLPGRRSTQVGQAREARRERFVVAGWRERDGELPEFLLARRHRGALVPAGTAILGLAATQFLARGTVYTCLLIGWRGGLGGAR